MVKIKSDKINDRNEKTARENLLREGKEIRGTSIEGYDFDKGINYSEIVKSFSSSGYQASHLSKAIEITKKMIADKAFIYLGYTSNMVSSGLRDIFRYLVKNKRVNVIVTTAGGIEEDIIKCLGNFVLGDFRALGNFYHILEDKMHIVKNHRADFNKSFLRDNGKSIKELIENANIGNNNLNKIFFVNIFFRKSVYNHFCAKADGRNKLGFVYGNNLGFWMYSFEDGFVRSNDIRFKREPGMGKKFLVVAVARIDHVFKHLKLFLGNGSTPNLADKLLGFAAEHGSGNDF